MDDGKLDQNTPVSVLLHGMSADDWREQAVGDYLNCYLCGKPLNFSHQTDFALLTVDEEAHCLFCQVRTKKNSYGLQ